VEAAAGGAGGYPAKIENLKLFSGNGYDWVPGNDEIGCAGLFPSGRAPCKD